MTFIKQYDTRLADTTLDFLSDVLCDFCEQQEVPFISADDILDGNIDDDGNTLTAYSRNWLEKYIQVWNIVNEVSE